MIRKYLSQVEAIDIVIDNIYVVKLRSTERRFDYRPGQFLHLALEKYDPTMPWPDSRCFSMQSNPDEELIRITFAAKGEFTKRMASELRPGVLVWLKLPFGELFDHGHDQGNCVFIAGGTGVTPYLSLFTSTEFASYINPQLYLGVRSAAYHLYQDDFARAKVINPGFVVDVTQQDVSGVINIAKILEQHGSGTTYFVSGPPLMIRSFKQFLTGHGVSGEHVITDDWQ